MKKRLQIFERKKLFSADQECTTGSKEVRSIVCQDCGYQLGVSVNTTNVPCPKCGGRRFNFVKPECGCRKSLFDGSESEFLGNPETEEEALLKTYADKNLNTDQVQRLFSCSPEDLVERGYASISEDGSCNISPTAHLQSKLFAKLTITITKEMDLDPIMEPKEDIISRLASRGSICPKGIMIIKKAHSLPIEPRMFSEADEWIKDSGILQDLKQEGSMSIDDLDDILKDRYEDAPEGIKDILEDRGVITITGNNVVIN